MTRPLILLTNDDGVHAEGLAELYFLASALGECVIVAPDSERSGVSHALTLHRDLDFQRLGPGRIAVNGTPVDCVLLALDHLLDRRPACVLSGINHGFNLGRDTNYSGTVAAALEAAGFGVPALALSCKGKSGVPVDPLAARAVSEIVRSVLDRGLPPGTCLNVNIPQGAPRGIRLAPLSFNGSRSGAAEPASDRALVAAGWIPVTPLRADRTADGPWDGLFRLESSFREEG